MKKIITILTLLVIQAGILQAQMVGADAYILGRNIQIGINGEGGFEGVDTTVSPLLPGMHFRSNSQYFGFVANPQNNNWATFDGDFFTPGSPENGWGITIGANLSSASDNCTQVYDIPGSITNYSNNLDCITVDWEGTDTVGGTNLDVKIEYLLQDTALFYTTTISITNNDSLPVPELYYYRNMDPDNNVMINGTNYATNNTIVSQPGTGGCDIAQVSATQSTPWTSYVGFAATGADWRVTYGGFSNRNGNNIWNDSIGFTQALGSDSDDIAISMAYRIQNLLPGATKTFKYVTILSDSSAYEATNDVIYFSYPGSSNVPLTACANYLDTINTCGQVQISMAGPSVNDYIWAWSPAAGLSSTTGASVIANPSVETTYTATGTPIIGCLTAPVAYSIVVKLNTGANLTPTIAGISSICSGNPAVLDAGSGYSSYLWSTTETTQTISVTTSGAYTVTVSSASGCTGSASTFVTVNANPVAGYIFSPDSAFAPVTVNFTDTSSSTGGNIVNWQWNFGDGSYGTGSTPSHVYNTGGTFPVTLVVTNNTSCVDTVVDSVTVFLITSIKDLNNVNFSIYPNPVTNNLTIESSQPASIEILNIQGQLIENIAVNGRKTIIDVSDVPNGVYVMEMKTDRGLAVKKFIKE